MFHMHFLWWILFWVKPIDSDLNWNKISLFQHPFNEVIAKTALMGNCVLGANL